MEQPYSILGPCSAETQEQLMKTADQIAQSGMKIDLFRAGIWKPRTRPGNFEGVGTVGLNWLQEVKQKYQWPVAVEVASAPQVEAAIESGVDVLWIGARTATNPFSVQEVAEAIKGTQHDVWIKNPVNPDLDLWIGALERIAQSTNGKVGLIHRGFSVFRANQYRNHPTWQIPIEMKRRYPKMPMLMDPSHIAGNRTLIPELLQLGIDLDYDGWMVEVHFDPSHAWSDAAQQFKPKDLQNILQQLHWRRPGESLSNRESELVQFRQDLDLLDEEMLNLLQRRMNIAQDIGNLKNEYGMTILQTERVQETLKKWIELGGKKGLSKVFIQNFFEAVHMESIEHQGRKLN